MVTLLIIQKIPLIKLKCNLQNVFIKKYIGFINVASKDKGKISMLGVLRTWRKWHEIVNNNVRILELGAEVRSQGIFHGLFLSSQRLVPKLIKGHP